MPLWLIGIVTLIASESALAADTVSGSITRYGVYEMVGPASGPWRVGAVQQTSEIQAKQGLRFGVDFEIHGISGTSASVGATMEHPAIVKPDGSSTTQSVDQMGPFPVAAGAMKSSYGFTFDHPYELVPGDWKIKITFQGQVVTQQSFHITIP